MKKNSNVTPLNGQPLKFKQHFKNLNYYSMPSSILFAFRKRVNFLCYFFFTLFAILYTIL